MNDTIQHSKHAKPVPLPQPADRCFIVSVPSRIAGLATSSAQLSSSASESRVVRFTHSVTSSRARQTATFSV